MKVLNLQSKIYVNVMQRVKKFKKLKNYTIFCLFFSDCTKLSKNDFFYFIKNESLKILKSNEFLMIRLKRGHLTQLSLY